MVARAPPFMETATGRADMAQVDTSIYGNLLRPAPSLTENLAALDQADMQRTQLAQQKVNLIGAQQAQADQQAVRSLYQQGVDPNTQDGFSKFAAASPTTAMAMRKATVDNAKTQAETTHLGAQTDQALAAAQKTRMEHAIQVQSQIAQAAGAATDQASWDRGLQIAQTLGADITNVPKVYDPATAKSIHDQALSGAEQLDAHYKELTAAETARHNKADEANTVRGQNVTRQNSQDTLTKDYAVAGLNRDGTPTADVASTVKAIGEYRMSPPTLQALRSPRMAAIMDQVNRQYPGFDATQYGERQKAVKDFGSGAQGLQIQAGNTALNHLETLAELAAAQKNGNTQLFNKLANDWAAQTGSAVPTNLQGAITMVGPEISKAVVGAGGGVADREHVDAALKALSQGSPAQQAGQIATIQEIFGGRLAENARTYKRTTRMDNFGELLSPAAQAVLSKRTGGAPAAAPAASMPDDIAAILKKHGGG